MSNRKSNNHKRNKTFKPWEEQFVGIPVAVLHSMAFVALSKVERALLLEFLAQYNGRNNGQLLCSVRKLASRGFGSADTLHRAKKMLIEAGFIYETVAGHRPNTASWYALTWRPLDPSVRYDAYVAIDFNQRGYNAYKLVDLTKLKDFRAKLLSKKTSSASDGIGRIRTVPPDGLVMEYLVPLRGTARHDLH